MRTLLLSVGLMLVLAPAASAQVAYADSATQLKTPESGAVVERGVATSLSIEILYTYSVMGVSFSQTQIDLEVLEAPEWLAASFSPAAVMMDVNPTFVPATTHTTFAATKLVLAFASGAPGDALETLKIRATAQPNGNIKSSQAEESLLIAVHDEGSCTVVAPAESKASVDDPKPSSLETKTLGSTPTVSPAVLASAALVGAVAGAGIAWRARRRG